MNLQLAEEKEWVFPRIREDGSSLAAPVGSVAAH